MINVRVFFLLNLVRFFFKNGILHNGVYPFVRLKPFFILGVSRGRIKLKKKISHTYTNKDED